MQCDGIMNITIISISWKYVILVIFLGSFYVVDYNFVCFCLQGERDELTKAREELERRMEERDAQLLDKDEELFLQLEKVVRLEEECDKVWLVPQSAHVGGRLSFFSLPRKVKLDFSIHD